jgi:hypothetical protein
MIEDIDAKPHLVMRECIDTLLGFRYDQSKVFSSHAMRYCISRRSISIVPQPTPHMAQPSAIFIRAPQSP